MLEAPARPAPARPASAAARGNADSSPEDLLAELEGRALDGWRRAMDPMLAPVIELLKRSETLEQFEAGLAGRPRGDGRRRAAPGAGCGHIRRARPGRRPRRVLSWPER